MYQVNLLKSRGLNISDETRAARYLQNISYYRLSGYMYPFLSDVKNHHYTAGASFEDVLDLYRFDRELRILVFSAIEKIEIALRTQIANNFSIALNDPFWYIDAKYFYDPVKHTAFLNNLPVNASRTNYIFISHFFETYTDPFPPIWVIFEILSMGQFSILYNNSKKSPPRKAVADYFGVKETVFTTWLHTLVYIRNICAHHVRLWNKDLRIKVKLPIKTTNRWLSNSNITSNKIYTVLAIIIYMLDTITPHNTFRQKVRNLLTKYPNTNITAMGFPKDWESDQFWGFVIPKN